jgi:DNA-binding MltR family transcriptional regulator
MGDWVSASSMNNEETPSTGEELVRHVTGLVSHLTIDEGTLSYFRSLFKESDRGAVLISATRLEEKLGLLHRNYITHQVGDSKKVLEELFRPYAPLSSFSAKIQLAYAYGLIEAEDYADLNVLRKIRNDAAHTSVEFSLETNEMRQRIMHIKAAHRVLSLLPMMTELFTPEELAALNEPEVVQEHVKMYYILSCFALEARIISLNAATTPAVE